MTTEKQKKYLDQLAYNEIFNGTLREIERNVAIARGEIPEKKPQILEPTKVKSAIPTLEDYAGKEVLISKEIIKYDIISPGAIIDSTYRPINHSLDAAKDLVLNAFETNAAMMNHPFNLASELVLMTYIDITRDDVLIGTTREVIISYYAIGTVTNIHQSDFLLLGLFTHPTEREVTVYQGVRSDTEEIIAAGYVHKQKDRYRVEPIQPFQMNRFNLMI